jgi:hypothetical protein
VAVTASTAAAPAPQAAQRRSFPARRWRVITASTSTVETGESPIASSRTCR